MAPFRTSTGPRRTSSFARVSHLREFCGLRHGLSKIAVAGTRSPRDDSSAGPQSFTGSQTRHSPSSSSSSTQSAGRRREGVPPSLSRSLGHGCGTAQRRTPRSSSTKSIRRESPREAKLFNHGPPAGAAAGGEAHLPRPLRGWPDSSTCTLSKQTDLWLLEAAALRESTALPMAPEAFRL